MDYNFQRKRMDTIPEDRKLEAPEQAAKHFNYIEFSWRDFNKISTISASAIKVHFGSWTNACQKFIEFKMGGEISADNFVRFDNDVVLITVKKRKD
jgi:hypothetical protein